MLNLITKSKIRQKIILLSVYSSDKSYYLSEIARLIGSSPGTTQRELERLVKNGLLLKEKKSNSVYFKTNTANSVFNDFKNIVDKTIGIKHILKEELENAKGIDFAFLFGSYIKDDFGPSSDIDLYVIGVIKEKDLYEAMKKVEAKIYREINYHLAGQEEFKKELKKSFFHKEILENFILILGDEDEFRKFIN